jgi:hypothetical protein
MLSHKQCEDVCLLYNGTHQQCRYLVEDKKSWNWHCCKLQKREKTERDKQIAKFVAECKKKGLDPTKQGVALGDNCPGYPRMKFIEVGYDKTP